MSSSAGPETVGLFQPPPPFKTQAMASNALEEVQAAGDYVSAFPNVGLVVWQAGFVLAEWLIRAAPLGSWRGRTAVELGCGVGQLGVPLACTGATVTLTDLPHIVGLTAENVAANVHAMAVAPRVMPFVWGATEPAALGYGGGSPVGGGAAAAAAAAAAAGVALPTTRSPHQGPLDLVVAADVSTVWVGVKGSSHTQ